MQALHSIETAAAVAGWQRRVVPVVGLALMFAIGAERAGPGLAAALLLLSPLAEELLFRDGLQRALVQRGVDAVLAAIASALAFALLHGVARGAGLGLAVFAPGLATALLYRHTGRVMPCVLLHAAMNLSWIVLVTHHA